MLKFALKLTYVTGRRYNKTLMNYFFTSHGRDVILKSQDPSWYS